MEKKFHKILVLIAVVLLQLNVNLWGETVKAEYGENFSGELNYLMLTSTGIALSNKVERLYPAANPDPRDWHSMWTNRDTGEVYIFGGYNSGGSLGDTQYFSQDTWNVYEGSGPSKRSNAAVTDGGLLFGGVDDASFRNETWQFSVSSWTEIITSSAPSSRSEHTLEMTDEGAVLFGGSSGSAETWIFDTQTENWNEVTPAPSPPDRKRHVSWVNEAGEVIIFGGQDGAVDPQFFNDTWKYDPLANEWNEISVSTSPTPREYSAVYYDEDSEAAVLFGGGQVADGIFLNDFWIFHNNDWHRTYPYYSGAKPSSRTSSAGAYYPDRKSGIFFGGYQYFDGKEEKYFGDTWEFVLSTGGVYTSPTFDTGKINTWLDYQKLDWAVKGSSGTVKFQFASSADSTPDNFTGPDGSTDSYYTTPGDVPAEHSNNRYFRYRFFLENDTPGALDPLQVETASVTYNHIPTSPNLSSFYVENGGVTGSPAKFAWSNSSDNDNDELTYHLKVAKDENFSDSEVVISTENIEELDNPTFTEQELDHGGPYYWKVRAYDGSVYGNFSSTWTIYIDTVPPAAVTELTAQRADLSGAAYLEWTVPDQRQLYKIRWSKNYDNIDNEFQWDESSEMIYDSTFTVGGKDSKIVTGLADGTTYSFSVRLEDEAGNLSGFSPSPSCKTNSPPEITLTQNVDGEWGTKTDKATSTITFGWDIYDPDPEDTHEVDIWLAEDVGRDYDILVATGIPAGEGEYNWDSRHVRNAPSYQAKVIARDQRNLENEITTGTIDISNYNDPPQISILNPEGGEKITGILDIDWDWFDPNRPDTVYFEILVSTDGGQNFTYIEEYVPASDIPYRWGSGNVPDTQEAVIKVIGIDDGQPSEKGEDITGEFEIKNDFLAPEPFDLISPEYDSFSYSTQVVFSWEETTDPDGGDITYSLCISDNSDFVPHTLYEDLTATQKELVLEDETIYYWKVIAMDEKLVTRESSSVGKFAVDVTTPAVLSTWPENGSMLVMTGTETVRFQLNKNYNIYEPERISVHEYLEIYDEYGNYISAMNYDLSLDTVTYILKITPENKKFLPSREYTVNMGKEITDVVGHSFGGDREIKFVRLLEPSDTAEIEIPDFALLEIPARITDNNGYYKISREQENNDVRMADRQAITNPSLGNETVSMVKISAYNEAGEEIKEFSNSPSLTMKYREENEMVVGENIDENYLKIFRLQKENAPAGTLNSQINASWEYMGGENNFSQNKVKVKPGKAGIFSLKAYSEPVKDVSEIVNYPNPFKPHEEELKIKFIITKDMDLKLEFYTLTGDLVYREEKEFRGNTSGTQVQFTWDGKNGEGRVVANGMYFGRIVHKGKEKENFLIGVVK
ncbi:MAG: Kelch repeat-containing protein [Elusimicrobiota bacterium]